MIERQQLGMVVVALRDGAGDAPLAKPPPRPRDKRDRASDERRDEQPPQLVGSKPARPDPDDLSAPHGPKHEGTALFTQWFGGVKGNTP